MEKTKANKIKNDILNPAKVKRFVGFCEQVEPIIKKRNLGDEQIKILLKDILKEFVRIWGKFPVFEELRILGVEWIVEELERFKYKNLRMEIKSEEDYRKVLNEYFNIEILEVISKIGKVPTQIDLNNLGRGDLNGISREIGGLAKAERGLGFKTRRLGEDSLRHFENIKRELELIKEKLGREPSSVELENIGRRDIVVAAKKYHGGFENLKRKIGWKVFENEYKDWEKLKEKLEEIKEKLGVNNIPSLNKLPVNVRYAIEEYHGGIARVREKLGEKPLVRRSIFKLTEEDFDKEIKGIIERYGRIPSLRILQDDGYGHVLYYMEKNDIGIIKLREKYGVGANKRKASINERMEILFYNAKKDENNINAILEYYIPFIRATYYKYYSRLYIKKQMRSFEDIKQEVLFYLILKLRRANSAEEFYYRVKPGILRVIKNGINIIHRQVRGLPKKEIFPEQGENARGINIDRLNPVLTYEINDFLDEKNTKERIKEVLDNLNGNLSENERKAIELVLIEGYTIEEASNIMEIRKDSLKDIYERGINKIIIEINN